MVLALSPLLRPQTPPIQRPDLDALPPLKTSITVTEEIRAEAPAPVVEIGAPRLAETPGVNLDERLRSVPGFSLFRRSSSLVAHPTTQGVSLRGIGSNGASRTLVLWDGVPMNDPFGGWVYWTRFAPEEIGRVEISEGASTSVFGDRAMGGVISLFSREAERLRLSGSYEAGNRNSHEISAGFSNLWARWAVSGNGRAYTTDGYFIVPAAVRGSVDQPAAVRFAAGDARADYFSGAHRVFLKFDLLAEERRNGTRLQHNSTGLGTVSAHYAREMARDGFSAVVYHAREQFHSTFSAVSASRNAEALTFTQTVPSEGTGAAAFWNHHGSWLNLVAGADVNRARGFSTDALVPSGQRVGGGTLLQHGVFAQTDFRAGPARLFLGARHDFTGAGGTFFSPSAGAVLGRRRLRARGSVYRSYRAPTLNELYRQFRVGNSVTQANPELVPEHLFGAEAGIDVSGESARASITLYRDSLSDLITNVTLSAAPNLIVRQRQNAAAALARGAELRAEGRRGPWRGEAAYLFADSRFRTGARVPQVPRHQGSAQLGFEHGGTLAVIGVRSYSSQFEDERNLRSMRLGGYPSVQLLARRSLAAGLSATVSVENLLDREYLAGFTPTPTIGPPRLWRAGLRWEGRLR